MSRLTVAIERVSCDLCGIDSEWLATAMFTTIGDVDLCRWCAAPPATPGTVLESGDHRVTFSTRENWSCSCGARRLLLFVHPRVASAVPSLATAYAGLHVHGRRPLCTPAE